MEILKSKYRLCFYQRKDGEIQKEKYSNHQGQEGKKEEKVLIHRFKGMIFQMLVYLRHSASACMPLSPKGTSRATQISASNILHLLNAWQNGNSKVIWTIVLRGIHLNVQVSGYSIGEFCSNIYTFFYGCIGSLLLRTGFLQLQQAGATLRCSARASHCGSFSCCGARALGMQASVVVARRLSSCGSQAQQLWFAGSRAQAQQLWCTGLVAPWHVGSSWTRA